MTSLTHDNWRSRAETLRIEGRAFIDGEYVHALSGKTFDNINPANGQVLGQVAACDAADVDRAVARGEPPSTPASGRAWRRSTARRSWCAFRS
jgi:acyl-CoA reductase-like NAD-dependent aldehyde dehydrogenase